MAKSRRPRRDESSRPAIRNSRTTVSGAAKAGSAEAAVDTLAGKLLGSDELALSLPFNPLKASEYEPQVLEGPKQGPSVTPHDPIVGASTVTERNSSAKVGSGGAIVGINKTIASFDRVRADSSKQPLITHQGVPVADNQHPLKAGAARSLMSRHTGTNMTIDMNSRGRESRTTPWPGQLTIVALSHLRWDFVYQRPQHLLSRAARQHRVLYVEEPKRDASTPFMEVREDRSGVTIAVPHLSASSTASDLRLLLDQQLARESIQNLVLWYYTPMALSFTDHLRPCAVVYDCMDELSAFAGAPPELPAVEAALLDRADLVLTGGHSLYAAKQRLHPNVHEFPSGVDVEHFAAAQRIRDDPPDQSTIPKPRIGFFGVLDERLDRELLASVAAQAPGWAFVLIGPVAKINPNDLPRGRNLHYLGPKSYNDLPRYIAGWDVAMMPFALNAATTYISPTKTPEYLAAGKPVVSTPIADVVRTYGGSGLAHIAATPERFVQAIRDALCQPVAERLDRVPALLRTQSWDGIWSRISERLRAALIESHLKSSAVVASAGQRWA